MKIKLAVITPVRNEQATIGITIRCMVNQTVLPDIWIIVDDGSEDRTREIVESYASQHKLIKYIKHKNRGHRLPGKGVVEAFNYGVDHLNVENYDIISKLDGDLSFDSKTIEKLMQEFERYPRLGIAGGIRYESRKHHGPLVHMPVAFGYVGGPCKFYRKECLNDIGWLKSDAGWDGVDIVRARQSGWDTREIQMVRFDHIRATGTASKEGIKKANIKYGYVSYTMGGYHFYFIIRAFFRSIWSRNPMVMFWMMIGYYGAWLKRAAKEDVGFNIQLKELQDQNLKEILKSVFKVRYFNR